MRRLAAAAAATVLACTTEGPARVEVGLEAPSYATRTLAGDSVSLALLRGKPVLLNVWATWCIPCVKEMPALDALQGLDVSESVQTDEHTGKVSIVGAGMRSHPGVAAKVFETLGEAKINIEMISTSPIKISCVIAADRVSDAVKALHKAFDLGEDAIRKEEPTGTEHRPTVAS